MFNILHRVGIENSSLEKVYNAIANPKELASWWTTKVIGVPKEGSMLRFIFGNSEVTFEIMKLEPNKKVIWKCVSGAPEWIDTLVEFTIEQQEDEIALLFKHKNWKEEVQFMHHCSTQWAYFLIELRHQLSGKRQARPFGGSNFESISTWTK